MAISYLEYNKLIQFIRNQIIFILGLSIKNKLTVLLLWIQGTSGSQLYWLTPGLKEKNAVQWVLAADGDASCVCCSAVQEMCSPRTIWETCAFLIAYSTFCMRSHVGALKQGNISLSKKMWEGGLRWWGVKQNLLSALAVSREMCYVNTIPV